MGELNCSTDKPRAYAISVCKTCGKISVPFYKDCRAPEVMGRSTNPPMPQLHTKVITGDIVSDTSHLIATISTHRSDSVICKIACQESKPSSMNRSAY